MKVTRGLVFLLLSALYLSSSAQKSQSDYYRMLSTLYERSVPFILAKDLNQRGTEQFVILDTREKEEFDICHLEHAIWVGYDRFRKKTVKDLPRNQPIVLYCTVGYRSEQIGEILFRMGFTKVYNLYGGIVDWKNRGYPVIDVNGTPTDKVHTYSKEWSQWLSSGETVY